MTSTFKAYLIIIILFALHLSTANLFDLTVDEAHYALFAFKLDLSYFDHPPMVGWILALMQPFGLNDFTVRIPPIILMALNNYLLFRISLSLYSQATALKALVLFNLAAIVQLVSYGMVPDVPLITFSLLLVMLLLKMSASNSIGLWLSLGALTGLTGLSKYTAIITALGILIWLYQCRLLIAWLKQWQFYLAIFIALILISPVIIWNYQHDWISFNYQFAHGTKGSWHINNVGIMLALFMVSYSPLLVILAIKVFSATKGKQEKLLFNIAVLHLLAALYSAGNGEFLPHWGMMGFLFMTPLAAKQLTNIKLTLFNKSWLVLVSAISLIIVIFVFVILLTKPTYWQLATANRDLVGWSGAAQIGQKLAQKYDTNILWVTNWTHASRISWYARPTKVQVVSDKISQYTLWNGNAKGDDSAILIVPEISQGQFSLFNNNICNEITSLDFQKNNIIFNSFSFYYCQPIDSLN